MILGVGTPKIITPYHSLAHKLKPDKPLVVCQSLIDGSLKTGGWLELNFEGLRPLKIFLTEH